jgi:hypothetical protein
MRIKYFKLAINILKILKNINKILFLIIKELNGKVNR